jgi:MbtH protein
MTETSADPAAAAGSELFDVVRNDEEQYSVWPAASDPPAGWRATGFRATRAQCLDHIDQVWTDLRPLSARS